MASAGGLLPCAGIPWAGISCAMAAPPATAKLNIATPASMMDFIGIILSYVLFFAPFRTKTAVVTPPFHPDGEAVHT
jgi:hypothetical protein